MKNKTEKLLRLYFKRLYKNTIQFVDLQNVFTVNNSFSQIYSRPHTNTETVRLSEEQIKEKYRKIKNKRLKSLYSKLLLFVLTGGVSLEENKRPEVSPIHFILGIPSLVLFLVKVAINSVIDAVAYAFNIKKYGEAYNTYNDPNEFRLGYFGKRSSVAAVFKIAISWALLIEPFRLLWQTLVVAPFVAAYNSNKYATYLAVAFIIALFIGLSFTTFGVGGLVALPAITKAVAGFSSVYYAAVVKVGAVLLISGALLTASNALFVGGAKLASFVGKVTGISVILKQWINKFKKPVELSASVPEVSVALETPLSTVHASTTKEDATSVSNSRADEIVNVSEVLPEEIEMVPVSEVLQEPHPENQAAILASFAHENNTTPKIEEGTAWYNDFVETIKEHPFIAIGAGVIGFKVTSMVIGATLIAQAFVTTAAFLKLSGAAVSAYSGSQVAAANPHLFGIKSTKPNDEVLDSEAVEDANHQELHH